MPGPPSLPARPARPWAPACPLQKMPKMNVIEAHILLKTSNQLRPLVGERKAKINVLDVH